MILRMDTNILASLGGILLTGVITYGISRISKASDARGQYETTLLGIGPKIIEEQNRRIDELSKQWREIWQREQECRHDLNTALRRIAALEKRMPE